jgi:hypothetical protein
VIQQFDQQDSPFEAAVGGELEPIGESDTFSPPGVTVISQGFPRAQSR